MDRYALFSLVVTVTMPAECWLSLGTTCILLFVPACGPQESVLLTHGWLYHWYLACKIMSFEQEGLLML